MITETATNVIQCQTIEEYQSEKERILALANLQALPIFDDVRLRITLMVTVTR